MKRSNRRVLHQPLFPIQWNPPPPPPPRPPPPLLSPDSLTTTTTTTPAATSPTHHHSSTTTKTAIIAASTSIALLLLLYLLFLLFQHRAIQNSSTKSKREASFRGFLAPAGCNDSHVGSTALPRHTEEMVELNLNHPSPELKPLPPLLTAEAVRLNLSHPSPEIKPLPPLPRQPPVEVAMSDEDTQFFVPKRSLEKSYSWSATTRFSIGSSPNLTQRETSPPPPTQPVDSDKEIVWGRFKSRSLRFDEDMIEITTSFGKERMARRGGGASPLERENRVLNVEKTERIEILVRALTVTTEDVCGALLDGKHLCH